MEITSVLIANRGEIALRIMRSVRAQGMRSIAVYSEADARAPHVEFADDAVCIGRAPVAESYLRGERIIEAALASGAQLIHPGYGFLSENAAFARAVVEAGLVFVGPTPEAIEVMGDKAVSKRAMLAAGVPCVPGYQGEDQSFERLYDEAMAMGFPIMVKASAGGGGRGMRLVGSAVELESAIKLARSEAENAFGCGDLILEKAVIRPRHVEIQVFADQHGGVIHFGERDCSVQRRHQKVIEEAPCPVMNTGLRERMAQAATEAARAVNYVGAGTVEFLLDEGGEFYFLEMNTRLQVEHPVTEMVTGQDLVALQLKVAQGGALELNQQQVEFKGHAIEARLYAEDPGMDFLPCTGPVHLWQEPRGEGIRVDAGITTGGEVSPFYDSMVAKVIAHGDTREQARQRLLRALDDTVLIGTANNRDFLIAALGQARFASGEATTAFLEEVFPDGVHSVAPGMENYSAAAVIQHVLGRDAALGEALPLPDELLGWSSTADLESVHRYAQTQETLSLSVRAMDKNSFRVHHLDRVDEVEVLEITDSQVRLMINSRTWRATFFAVGVETLHLVVKGLGQFSVTNVLAAGGRDADASGGPSLAAPMHGVMIAIEVKVDERVCKGDTLAVMEAMKMQHALVASVDGTVTSIAVAVGDQVGAGDLILEVAPDNASTDSKE